MSIRTESPHEVGADRIVSSPLNVGGGTVTCAHGVFPVPAPAAYTVTRQALPDGTPGPSLYCAVIVKRVDERTRSKTSINELLRD
mgnify:CR=1 FL=1